MFPRFTPGGFEIGDCLTCADASLAAYAPEETAEARALQCGGKEFAWLNSSETDTQGFVASNGQVVTVAFRGTYDLHTMIEDARIKLVKRGVYRVHSGFEDCLDSVWPEMVHAVDDFSKGVLPVYFTGHSKGGAQAKRACHRWRERQRSMGADGILTKPGGYSFGEPRSGDRHCARDFDVELEDNFFRVVDKIDFVPLVPFALGIYRHSGTEMLFNALGGFDRSPSWERQAAMIAVGVALDYYHTDLTSLKDHHMELYRDMVAARAAIKNGDAVERVLTTTKEEV